MEAEYVNEPTADDLAKRRVPCLIGYLHPFRLVESDTLSPWTCTIEQVNSRSWDYAALHETAGGLDVGLAPPYHLVVARDGALALPPIPELRSDQAAVEYVNRCLAALLLGGIYCEAITADGIDIGSIIDWRYIRSSRSGMAAPNRFHKLIRYGQAAPIEAIALYKPRTVTLTSLAQAMRVGLRILDRLPAVRGDYFLRGVTGIARRDWGAALANTWIVVEQVLSELWRRHVIEPTVTGDATRARRDQLTDTRTWTASARIELLYQKGILPKETVASLSKARKARNDLSHEGKHPTHGDALGAYDGICGLLTVALEGERPPLFDLDLADHMLSDPFDPPKHAGVQPTHWMEIPKLPGELELELAEATLRRRTSASNASSQCEDGPLSSPSAS